MFPGLTIRVADLKLPSEVPAQDGLSQARDNRARVPARIQVEEKVGPGLEGEGTVGEPADLAPEESIDPSPRLPPGEGEEGLLRVKAPKASGRPPIAGEPLPCLKEDLLRVGAPEDESEEVLGLLVGNAGPFANLLPKEADLLFDHVTEAQSSGHGLGGVFSGEDLGWEVQRPDHFQQRQSHDGGNPLLPPGADASAGRQGVNRPFNSIGIGHVPAIPFRFENNNLGILEFGCNEDNHSSRNRTEMTVTPRLSGSMFYSEETNGVPQY